MLTARVLEEAPIFRGCSGEELRQFLESCSTEAYPKGVVVFKAGAPAEYLYLVKTGVVELRFRVSHYLAWREISLGRIAKGRIFGWSSTLEFPQTYTLTAIAAEDVTLLKIAGESFRRLCSENSRLGYRLMRNISGIIGTRFLAMQRTVMEMVQQELSSKEL